MFSLLKNQKLHLFILFIVVPLKNKVLQYKRIKLINKIHFFCRQRALRNSWILVLFTTAFLFIKLKGVIQRKHAIFRT